MALRLSSCVKGLLLLSVANVSVAQVEDDATAQRVPACRKSPEFHALKVAVDGDDANEKQELVFFNGKGYDWEEETNAVDKIVKFFGAEYMWSFDIASEQWVKVTVPSDKGPRPAARWKSAAATFHGQREMALFGGCTTTSASGSLNDLWVYTPSCCPLGGSWRQISTVNPPPVRRSHAVISNATHLIVYGGKNSKEILNDVWALPLAALREGSTTEAQWTQGASFPGSRRWGITGTLVTDATGRDFMAVFGGRMFNHHEPPHDHTYYNELWLYDLKKDSWSLRQPATSVAPTPRDHHAAVSLEGDLYIFGGRVIEDNLLSSVKADVWSFSLLDGAWKEYRPANATAPRPHARYMPGLETTVWKGRPALILSAGENFPGTTTKSSLNDVWAFVPGEEASWTELSPAQCSFLDNLAPTRWGKVLMAFVTVFGLTLLTYGLLKILWLCFGMDDTAEGRECLDDAKSAPYGLLAS